MSSSVKLLPLRWILLTGRPGTIDLAAREEPMNCFKCGTEDSGRDGIGELRVRIVGMESTSSSKSDGVFSRKLTTLSSNGKVQHALCHRAQGRACPSENGQCIGVEVVGDGEEEFDGQSLQRHWKRTAPYPKRTHTCGELTPAHAGSRVVLTGWLLPERKVSKALSFFPIKDSSGTTQLVALRKGAQSTSLSDVPVESTVLIEGQVRVRPEKDRRPGGTGEIEVQVETFTVLNPASPDIPFYPSDNQTLVNEELRARFRYLDLRRTELSNNLRKRSQVSQIVRETLHREGFLEVETPLLLKSSPEGAREFLVPSRVSGSAKEGHASGEPLFYSLPQSPQQPKQLLICSGAIDKYFQIAKCFRDEDGRKDRQPEFTQIDLEMAYVSWGSQGSENDGWRIGGHEVRGVIESLMGTIWEQVEGVCLPGSFKVLTYNEAMTRYGSDKPDIRFTLEVLQTSDSLYPWIYSFHFLDRRPSLANLGETLEALVVRGSESQPFLRANEQLDPNNEPTVDRIVVTSDNLLTWLSDHDLASSSFGVPFSSPEDHVALNKALRATEGDTIWLSRRPVVPEGGSTALGRVRTRLSEAAQRLGDYIPPAFPHFLWVTEFPLFTRSDPDKDFLARGRWSSTHHPFTAPMWQDIEAMYAGRTDQVRGQHYDLVLNGVEIGGGSVRIHDATMQEYIFSQVLQLTEPEKATFDHLLHALKYGAPPHGGIALGFDRLMSILCKTQSIRDVIAFPKTGAGTDLLFKSPAAIAKDVLYQYGIQPMHR
ncbi:tRNA synthetases class II-domain-containing protein [Melanogaster broomeanus]|nr:tRNA synthetases class II-domain-containing protein [Melanogaster broomeanus]